MDYYYDITLKPDAEMPINRLINIVYTKLHKALHDLRANSIGVSFPRYNVLLGNVLRVHGGNEGLTQLIECNWLGGSIGYCNISQIQQAPSHAKHRTISRKQTTMSPSALRRLIKRGSISEDEIKGYKTKMFEKGIDNPYVELVSQSNGHKHRRYIEFGDIQPEPTTGHFDGFGLSKTATVPWF